MAPAWAADTAPDTLGTLTQQWQQLRGQTGHFSGGAWNPEVDRWDGTKHRVMQALAQALVQRKAARPEWQHRLGAPEQRLAPGGTEHGRALNSLSQPCAGGRPATARDELLAYEWRGQRDMLLVWAHQGNGRLAGCAWLYQWE